MRLFDRLLSPIGFLAAGGSLALPFLGVSFRPWPIGGRFGWSGIDVTVGGKPAEDLYTMRWTQPIEEDMHVMTEPIALKDVFSAMPDQLQFLPGQPLAIVAVVMILAGILSRVLVGTRVPALVASAAGFVGAAALAGAEWLALRDTAPLTTSEFGFWICFTLLVLLGLINARAASAAPADAQPAPPTPDPRAPADPAPTPA